MRVFWAYTSLPDTHQIPLREMPVGTVPFTSSQIRGFLIQSGESLKMLSERILPWVNVIVSLKDAMLWSSEH